MFAATRIPNVLSRALLFVGLVWASSEPAARVSAADSDAGADRPHILFAFADDWGCYAGVYAKIYPGGPSDAAKTPNFDRIASNGLLFTRAFVSAPSCTPCRSALLSGNPFWRCGRASILQGAVWDGSLPSYPLILEENGYRIGYMYKVWGPGTPSNAPYGAPRTMFQLAGAKFNGFSQNAMRAEDRVAAKVALLDEVRKNLRSFYDADDDGRLDSDAPTCFWFGPTNVHRKWIAGSGKTLWGIDPETLRGKMPKFLPDTEIVRQDFADYLGEAAAFDAALGVIDEELSRLGILEDTMLVVSGDHGMPGMSRGKCNLYDFGTQVPLAIRWPGGLRKPGRVVEDLVSLPSLAPTFLESAGVPVPPDMTATSLTDLIRAQRDPSIDRSAVFTGRERHVARARQDGLPYPQRAIRTDDWLYILNFAPERSPMGDGPVRQASDDQFPTPTLLTENTFAAYGDYDASPTKAEVVRVRNRMPLMFEFAFGHRPMAELYDLQSDPDCLTNLAADPAFSETRDGLDERLRNHLRATDDPRMSDNVPYESGFYTAIPQPKRRR